MLAQILTGFSNWVNGSPEQVVANRSRNTAGLRVELHQVADRYPTDFGSLSMPHQFISAARLILTGDAGRIGAIKTVLHERGEQYVDPSTIK